MVHHFSNKVGANFDQLAKKWVGQLIKIDQFISLFTFFPNLTLENNKKYIIELILLSD